MKNILEILNFWNYGILALIAAMLVLVCAGVISSIVRNAFSLPDWFKIEEDHPTCSCRDRLEMENTEFDYRHDVARKEKDYE